VDGRVVLLFGQCPGVVFVVRTTTIVVNPATNFKKGDCSDLRSGVDVSVTGTTQPDRNILATTVQFKKNNNND
jgi:hypothetical protein